MYKNTSELLPGVDITFGKSAIRVPDMLLDLQCWYDVFWERTKHQWQCVDVALEVACESVHGCLHRSCSACALGIVIIRILSPLQRISIITTAVTVRATGQPLISAAYLFTLWGYGS